MAAFALKGSALVPRPFRSPIKRERNADTREIIPRIQYMNIFSIGRTLKNTIYEFRANFIPPLHV